MSAIPKLTEAEAYLAAIFDDPSGVELAEFVFVDEEQPDRCFRVWDFQRSWYANTSTYQIDYAGRSLGKTMGIRIRAFAFPFQHPGQEMLITAPELNHLRPITDKIENDIYANRLSRELLPRQRGNGINHQPQFQVRFINNARIVSRLPNRDGRGVKGQHPLIVEMDEGQDYPDAGWIELIETMKNATPGARWCVHGVSRGVRDRYYRYTMKLDPDIPFYVHRYMAMHRPSWSDEERQAKVAIYGGTSDNVDYRRNIYGEHGDATNPVFVLARLMKCVRIAESPWATEYNDDIYTRLKLNDELVAQNGSVFPLIDGKIPSSHLASEYSSFWAGADIGFTRDPTEILVFGELAQKGAESLLRLLLRVHLMRISAEDQAEVVRAIFDFYGERLRLFSMDKTGNGLPLYQMLAEETTHTTPLHIARRIKGYNFSSKTPVEFDDRELTGRERPEDAVINKNIVEFSTDELRKLVDAKPPRIELPHDQELLSEFQGQEIEYVRDEGSAAGIKKRYSGGSFHTLDAARMFIAGRNLMAIEETLKAPRRTAPTLDLFVG